MGLRITTNYIQAQSYITPHMHIFMGTNQQHVYYEIRRN